MRWLERLAGSRKDRGIKRWLAERRAIEERVCQYEERVGAGQSLFGER